jgi:hypothetical protein
MDQPEDRRWKARRKFWFPSGILVDRRGLPERRSGGDRRQADPPTLPPGLTADRRVTPDRRASAQRRSGERRTGPRRPSDRPSGPSDRSPDESK